MHYYDWKFDGAVCHVHCTLYYTLHICYHSRLIIERKRIKQLDLTHVASFFTVVT